MSDVATGGAPATAPAAPASAPASAPATPAAPAQSPSFSAGFRASLRAKDAAARAPKPATPTPAPTEQPTAAPDPTAPADAREAAPTEPAEHEETAPAAAVDDAQALKRWRELETSLDLPADLLDKFVEVPVKGGSPEYRTVKELVQQNMLLTDYSRNMNQLRRQQQQYEQYEQQRTRYFDAIKDPDFLLEDLEARGLGDTAVKMATKIAERVHQQRAIVEAAGHAAGQQEVNRMVQHYGWSQDDPRLDQVYQQAYAPARERAEQQLQAQQQEAAELRALRQKTKQLEEAQLQASTKRDDQQFSQSTNRALDQLLPKAFKVHGLDPANPVHRAKHVRHMIEYLETQPPKDRPKTITKELVLMGAQMVKEELAAIQRRENGANGAAKLPVHAMGSTSRPPAGMPGQPQSLPVSGMKAHLRKLDGR